MKIKTFLIIMVAAKTFYVQAAVPCVQQNASCAERLVAGVTVVGFGTVICCAHYLERRALREAELLEERLRVTENVADRRPLEVRRNFLHNIQWYALAAKGMLIYPTIKLTQIAIGV